MYIYTCIYLYTHINGLLYPQCFLDKDDSLWFRRGCIALPADPYFQYTHFMIQ